MRVLVLWSAQYSANLGVRVLAEGARSIARDVWGPSVEIEFQDFGPGPNGFNPGRRAVLADVGRRNGPVKRWLDRFDIVLDTGAGDSFSDIYGIRRLAMMAYTQRVAIGRGIPLVLMPQTIGPFNSGLGRWLAARTLSGATVVMARDGVSARFVSSAFGAYALQSTDVVFALPVPPRTSDHDVLLNVSGMLWQDNRHIDSARYRSALRGLVDGLRARGREIALLPHVLDSPFADNDVRVLGEVMRTLDVDDAVIPRGLEEARSYIAGASLVIGSRMHACLNALSVGTPAVFWAYSRKFAPLLSDVGWHHGFDLRSEVDIAHRTLSLVDEMTCRGNEWGVGPVCAAAFAKVQLAVRELRCAVGDAK